MCFSKHTSASPEFSQQTEVQLADRGLVSRQRFSQQSKHASASPDFSQPHLYIAYARPRQHTPAYVSLRQRLHHLSLVSLTYIAYARASQHTPAYVSIRQRMRTLVEVLPAQGIRQGKSAFASIRQHSPAYVSIRQHTSSYASIREHASTPEAMTAVRHRNHVSIRQHTSACASIRQHASTPEAMTVIRHRNPEA